MLKVALESLGLGIQTWECPTQSQSSFPLRCSVSLGLSELCMSETVHANHSFMLPLPHSNNSNCGVRSKAESH